ncbi:MAG TPA: UDP-N-acetylglucosamine 2-epimerase (non-hydrolyzing), partial [Puia sp.]|nr:UDP-N-acetylglucosamine 2-epimerase (non-hydrolyzing) [Puia sp.]
MKIMHIVGNRPQFIKLALLYKELAKNNTGGFILHSGQHFDANMSRIFFDELDIPAPQKQLTVNPMSHNEMIGTMLINIDPVIVSEKPDGIIVYGDTNTTLAGALAARKRNVALVHIEAGIRTGDESMPEETNRYLADRMARFNFCCTALGMQNLIKEGYATDLKPPGLYHCGDLMLDAVLAYKEIALARPPVQVGIDCEKPFILATIHRAENNGAIGNLENIVSALNELHRHTPVLFPMHPNTKKIIQQHQLVVDFVVCEALGYLDTLALTQRCQSVITDSGGLSREAFFLSKPTLVV